MLIESSIGEVIDKLSILDIKLSKIVDTQKLEEIKKEKVILQPHVPFLSTYPYKFLYSILFYINCEIWDLTDRIKSMNFKDDPLLFATLSHSIFEHNQKRFRLKDRFNRLNKSSIQEQKSYLTKVIQIEVQSISDIYPKIPDIYYNSLEYDILFISGPCGKELHTILGDYPFLYESGPPNTPSIPLSELPSCPEHLISIFSPTPISYISGGLLGDFIHQLSVINEMYLKTGRKGLLYIGNIGDNFSLGIETAYKDTYDLVTFQPYISSYLIHKNESCDINLTAWRQTPFVYKMSWYNIFKNTYNIEWGSHPWISIPTLSEYKSSILISNSRKRPNQAFNYKILIDKYPLTPIYFISQSIEDYDNFIKESDCSNIPFLKVNSLWEFSVIVQSCKLFIGNLSMPSALASAMWKTRIILLPNNSCDTIHNMNTIWNNYFEFSYDISTDIFLNQIVNNTSF